MLGCRFLFNSLFFSVSAKTGSRVQGFKGSRVQGSKGSRVLLFWFLPLFVWFSKGKSKRAKVKTKGRLVRC
jgi:hypothetical protein